MQYAIVFGILLVFLLISYQNANATSIAWAQNLKNGSESIMNSSIAPNTLAVTDLQISKLGNPTSNTAKIQIVATITNLGADVTDEKIRGILFSNDPEEQKILSSTYLMKRVTLSTNEQTKLTWTKTIGINSNIWSLNVGGFSTYFLMQQQAGPGGVVQQGQKQEDPCGKFLWKKTETISSTVLNGVVITVYDIEVYEKCVKITSKDKSTGNILETKTVQRDGNWPGSPVSTYNEKVKDLKVSGNGITRTGEIKMMTVEKPTNNCKDLKIVQTVKSSQDVKFANGQTRNMSNKNWIIDGANPYPSTITPVGTNQVGMIDIPSVSNLDEFNTAKDNSRAIVGNGGSAEFTITNQFETFFYCDGVLIGWISWDTKYSFTVAVSADPVTIPSQQIRILNQDSIFNPPQWHGPADQSQSAQAGINTKPP